MRIAIVLICLLFGLATLQLSIAGDKKGGGGKAAHSGGGGAGAHGGAGGAGAAHMMGGGAGNHGMHAAGQHTHSNLAGGGNGIGHQGGHGLNSHTHAAGLNSRHQGVAGAHSGNFAHHQGNAFHNEHNAHFAHGEHWHGGHWRPSHWRNSHEVFYGYHRAWHDYGWWSSHYDVAVFGYGWGPWYWDGGYWFPAWGYTPGFVYGCDCPIYSYANLPPDQVVVNVQEALQDQGYYSGEIDGQLGQRTRDALGQYQKDHQLDVTAAIDEPTVQALGLMTEQS